MARIGFLASAAFEREMPKGSSIILADDPVFIHVGQRTAMGLRRHTFERHAANRVGGAHSTVAVGVARVAGDAQELVYFNVVAHGLRAIGPANANVDNGAFEAKTEMGLCRVLRDVVATGANFADLGASSRCNLNSSSNPLGIGRPPNQTDLDETGLMVRVVAE
jgi:hypothetical protein